MKPAARLNEFGQSAWRDLIGRKLIHSGELSRMVEEDGIRGVTANPAIFEKAILETDEYDEQLEKLISQEKKPLDIYEAVAVTDVRAGCDALRPLFDRLQGKDGFVSLEVSPYIARDTGASTRRWTSSSRRSATRTCRGRSPSPTPRRPTKSSSAASGPIAGRSSRRRAPPGSGRSGLRPGPRTRRTATSCTSSRSSAGTPSTPCRSGRSRPSTITESSRARR